MAMLSRAAQGAPPWRRWAFFGCLAAATAAVAVFGCREEIAIEVDTNLPPDTYLTSVPADSATTVYYAHLYWYGNDADGVISAYEFAIADSLPADEDTLTYRRTTRTDSIFALPVGRNQQVLGHRFYVRAIDNEGAVDPEPAWAFFGAVDLVAPTISFTRIRSTDPLSGASEDFASGDTVRAGWDVSFAWRGFDNDRVITPSGDTITVGRVVQYEQWLMPRQASPIPGGLGDTTIAYDDLESGRYQFNVRAVDDAGFAGLDPARVSFVWNLDPVTEFEHDLDPASGDSLPRFWATSRAWEGERAFFAGDTIPLVREAFGVAPVSIRIGVEGYDPDDFLGQGVADFEYRTGAGRWTSLGTSSEVAITGITTNTLQIQARCRDGYMRKDGTPATVQITVNQAPVLLDTLAFAGGEPVLAVPRLEEPVSLEWLVSQFFTLRVRTRAFDPDSTTSTFSYSFRTSGFLYGTEVQPAAGQICEYDVTIPPEWRTPGQYAIGVRVVERGYTDRVNRIVERTMPLRIVP